VGVAAERRGRNATARTPEKPREQLNKHDQASLTGLPRWKTGRGIIHNQKRTCTKRKEYPTMPNYGLHPVEQFQVAINEFLGGMLHGLSSTSSNIALGLGMF